MKLAYTHENRLFVSNAKNVLDNAGIQTHLKNEFSAGAMGDLAPIDAWMELWIVNDREHSRAVLLLKEVHGDSLDDTPPWQCQQCKEDNPANFSQCWNCENNNNS